MGNIEEIGVPYPIDRYGAVTRTGPSTKTSPGEREVFDHSNLWVPQADFQDDYFYAPTTWNVNETLHIPVRLMLPYNASGCVVGHKISYTFRRPRLWAGGLFSVRLWYTGQADTNKVIDTTLTFESYAESSGLTQAGILALTLPAPTSNDVIMISRKPETNNGTVTGGGARFQVTKDMDLLTMMLFRTRDGTNDTYTKNFEFIGAEFIYIDTESSDGNPPGYLMKS